MQDTRFFLVIPLDPPRAGMIAKISLSVFTVYLVAPKVSTSANNIPYSIK